MKVTGNSRRLGQSDLEVGPIAYGLWRFVGNDVKAARTRIETALDAGMTLIDVAAVYGLDWGGSAFGESETLLGKVLADAPALRRKMVLATKFGIIPGVPYDSGAAAVTVAIAKKVATNGVAVANEILDKVESLKGTTIPSNIHVAVTRNYGKTANDKVNGLLKDMFLATGFVTILIYLFLGLRPTFVAVSVIPVVILMTVFSAWALGFTIGLALLAGVAFGILPALRAGRADLNETLKTGAAGATAGRREGRLRNTLVVAQIALSLVLLTGAGLLIKSFLVQRHPTGLGYNPMGVLTARFELQPARYDDSAQVRLFQQELVSRLGGQPGFQGAAVESHIFLGAFVGHATRVLLEGESEPVPMERGPAHGYAVSDDYFRVMEIPVLRGRGFTGQDRMGSPGVALVNGEAAKRYWPNGDPVGRRLRIGDGPWLTVVGLVGDLSRRPRGTGSTPLLYTNTAQEAARPFRVLVRFRGDRNDASTTLKAVARTIDPDEPVEDILTLEEDLALQLTPIRIMMYMLGGLGAIALGLAAFGIYGVMAYLVARKSRELGIRAALGAEAARLWRYVVSQGLRLTGFGVALGLVGAVFLTRTLQQVLFNVRSTDPFVYGAVALLLALIALVACWGPARRATRVDPIEVLREE